MSKLAITTGDPAGVGPEIIETWARAHPEQLHRVVVLGPVTWTRRLSRMLKIEVIPIGGEDFRAEPGKPSVEGAAIAVEALEMSARGCDDGQFTGVVTGPISKEWAQKAGFAYPGQTDFFAARWKGEPSMAFAGGKMKVVLLTWHIPLAEVPTQFTRDNFVRGIKHCAELARAYGVSRPRIGICGFNPHAGENGLLGREEVDLIEPLLGNLPEGEWVLSKPQAADTLFWRHLQGNFDVVLALYHDQGLAPLKTIDFESSVNITMGLPYVRTSPDHGTGFALAGKGVASAQSFTNAVGLAQMLIASRLVRNAQM
jgi:4-hydroxythreonine-4-phosphate dehydrogenase